jgi:CubicO group peptidase (beta-lactamase class C family)
MNLLPRISDLMDGAVADGVFPGASLLVAHRGAVAHLSSHGTLSDEDKTLAGPSTIYDIASLTKPLAMAAALMLMEARGRLDTGWSAERQIEGFRTSERSLVTVERLLSHRSGLPAWAPFHEQIDRAAWGSRAALEKVWKLAGSAPLKCRPGEGWEYSDLGFMALHEFFEREFRESLDTFTDREIYRPLDMRQTFFMRKGVSRPPSGMRFAPVTGGLVAEADDENCRCMGGVSGHAGLYSTVTDLHKIASELLRGSEGGSALFPREIVRKYWTRPAGAPPGTHALGWDTPSSAGSSSGIFFSQQSVGHLGFTGCSIWLDPVRSLEVILLSNRVCPTRGNERIKLFRPVLHDMISMSLSL